MAPIKNILHLSPFFLPNIGGVETHLFDLIFGLDNQGYRNTVLTYSPITTTNVSWKTKQKFGKHSYVYRFRWFGFNLFNRLEKFPLLNFLYITPYLLIRSFLFILKNNYRPTVIHTHGINAALIGLILKKIFKLPKLIVSIYSTYDNVPFNSFFTKFLLFVLNHCDCVLTQSDSSVKQLINLGVDSSKVDRYYHWVDLTRFKPQKKPSQFSILFVGRLIPQKNALLIAKLAPIFPNIQFNFIGTGPEYPKLLSFSKKHPNIHLIGDVAYSDLNFYYQQASLLCVPSKYHEGWGRIIAEAISCATPVISSNLGGTIEAADNSVAIFIRPTLKNFVTQINKLYPESSLYQTLQQNCRPYALTHYSKKNLNYITRHY